MRDPLRAAMYKAAADAAAETGYDHTRRASGNRNKQLNSAFSAVARVTADYDEDGELLTEFHQTMNYLRFTHDTPTAEDFFRGLEALHQ